MSDRNETREISEYENLTAEELEKRLQDTFFRTDKIDGLTYRELSRLNATLEKKKPLEYTRTPEEAWADFLEVHGEELERLGTQEKKREEPVPEPRRRKTRPVLRYALVAVIVLTLLVGATITASAMGVDLWAWVPRWSGGNLRFDAVQPAATMTPELREAMETLDTMEAVLPRWIPEGFSLTESTLDPKLGCLNNYYTNQERHLSVSVFPIAFFDRTVFQTEDEPPLEYEAGNRTHYIMKNRESLVAVWYTDNYYTLVSGSITLEEMKRIIDSVYTGH